jgi:hypothetical protein
MSLSGHDLAELDRLAIVCAAAGKKHAWVAYTRHAIAQGWGNSSKWIAGRTAFQSMWRKHRKQRKEATHE